MFGTTCTSHTRPLVKTCMVCCSLLPFAQPMAFKGPTETAVLLTWHRFWQDNTRENCMNLLFVISFSFDIFSKPLQFKPVPLASEESYEYMLLLKQEFRGSMRDSPYFVKPLDKKKGTKVSCNTACMHFSSAWNECIERCTDLPVFLRHFIGIKWL